MRLRQHRLPGSNGVRNRPGPRGTRSRRSRPRRDPGHLTGQVVFDAAQRGDRTARELFGQIGYWLGVGIASVVNLLDIELVVIGGGLVTAGDLLLDPARESFSRFLFSLPEIVPARFGPDAGVVGAAALALDNGDLHRPVLSQEATARGHPAAECQASALPPGE